MIALVEGAKRQRTPNEIALAILLAGLTIIFLMATVTLRPFGAVRRDDRRHRRARRPARLPHPDHHRRPAVRDRHRRHGPRRALQRAGDERPGGRGSGDVDVILLDKTGTITYGNRSPSSITPRRA